ncbi:MAG: 2-amino-4-hydroxy-6-hydroxymethyldihydropteridine diphosphokinase [Marinoscillum sp.]
MKGIFLLLGTNLGDRLQNLKQAAQILEAHEMFITDYSSIYESAPWGEVNQPWFLNMVLRIDTIHNPQQLLQCCLDTEIQMGRKRHKKWGERIIDIDVLYYDNVMMDDVALTLPHPGIPIRRFTLMPLTEIAPNESHPILNQTNEELLGICPDELECRKSETDLIL